MLYYVTVSYCMFLETKPTKSAVVRVSNQTTFSGETDVFFFQMEDNCLTKIQGGGAFLLRTRSFGRDLVFIVWLVKVYCPEKGYVSSLMLCLSRSILNRCTQPIKRHTKCTESPFQTRPNTIQGIQTIHGRHGCILKLRMARFLGR